MSLLAGDSKTLAELFCIDYLDFQMQGKVEGAHFLEEGRFAFSAIIFVSLNFRPVLKARDLDKGMKPSRRKDFKVKPPRDFGSLPGAFRN